jgi:hypothetical protein
LAVLIARLKTWLCKNIVAKSREVKTGCNVAESSKEGCDDGGDDVNGLTHIGTCVVEWTVFYLRQFLGNWA